MLSCRYLKLLISPIIQIKSIQNISTSQTYCQQQVMITGQLAKMLNRAQKQKKKSKSKPSKFIPNFSDPSSDTARKFGPSAGSKRRAQQVSLVLYDYISQIIHSGDLSPKIAAMMVEVTKVKMLPDFSAIHIYWRGSGSERDEEVNKLLKAKEVKMRTLLTTYRPIAKIPQIVFLKDEDDIRLKELQKLFDAADYGDHYVPSTGTLSSIQHEPVIYIDDKKAEQIKNMGESFDKGETEIIHMDMKDEFYSTSTLSSTENSKSVDVKSEHRCIRDEYRDNLYGLNHTELTKKIDIWSHKIKHRKTLEGESSQSSVKLDSDAPSVSMKLKQRKRYKRDYFDNSLSEYMESKNEEKYEADNYYDSDDDH